MLNAGDHDRALADLPEVQQVRSTAGSAIERIQADLRRSRRSTQLDQVVVVNVASTEPPFELTDEHQPLERSDAARLERATPLLPASALYAWAALDLGLPYVNFTPSLGASFPALDELADERGAPSRRQGRQDRRDADEDRAGPDVRRPQPARS